MKWPKDPVDQMIGIYYIFCFTPGAVILLEGYLKLAYALHYGVWPSFHP